MRNWERPMDRTLGYFGLALIGVLGWVADRLGGAPAMAAQSAGSTGHRPDHRESRRMTQDARRKTPRTIAARLVAGVAAVALTLTGNAASGETW